MVAVISKWRWGKDCPNDWTCLPITLRLHMDASDSGGITRSITVLISYGLFVFEIFGKRKILQQLVNKFDDDLHKDK